MLYKGCTGGKKLMQAGYYKVLIDNLIDNEYYNGPEARNRVSLPATSVDSASVCGTSGHGLHLTPTKRKSGSAESSGKKRQQYRCHACDNMTIMVCFICRQDPGIGDNKAAYCSAVTDRACFRVHMCEKHL
jgi:hypothetical protein